MSGTLSALTTQLKRGNGATPEVFTAIANVGDISGPSIKANVEDATNHSSANGVEEYIPTTINMGELKFPVDFIPTNSTHSLATGLVGDLWSRIVHNYQIVFPDSTTWNITAYCTECSVKAPVKGKLTADVTLTITAATLA